MRAQAIDSLFKEMSRNERVFFVTADMGINLVERFAEKYPKRFLNVGIAEQNLIGVCAGLANAGMQPVAYTISNFLIHRCFEQIRNDISLNKQPVILLGTSTGYDNAPLGPTHHIIDDWGSLRAIRDIEIYCPSNISFAKSILSRLIGQKKSAYVRIPKGEFNNLDGVDDAWYREAAKPRVLLISYGTIAQSCLSAASGMSDISVLVLNKLHPLPAEGLSHIIEKHELIITAEDQFADCGLYSSLCQFVNQTELRRKVESLAPNRGYEMSVGSTADYYHRLFRIDAEGIRAFIDKCSSRRTSGKKS